MEHCLQKPGNSGNVGLDEEEVMKDRSLKAVPVALALAGVIGLATSPVGLWGSSAQAADEHIVMTPNDLKWVPGPATLPKGAQMSILYGDPTKEGLFAMRVRLPAGFHIAPHTHPKPEVVTILSGVLHMGHGSTVDKDKTKSLPTGSFFVTSPSNPHYVFIDQETIVQLNSVGPFGTTYVNEKDDPRKIQ